LASLGAASTVLVALRLISVAKFNPETAYGILQASGTGNVIIGTLISLIPSIAIIVALYLISMRVLSKSAQTTPEAEFTRWTLIFMLALIALLTIPLRYVIYAGPGILVFLALVLAVAIRTKRSVPASETGERSVPASETGERSVPASETGERSVPASETGERSVPASETEETGSLLERNWGPKGTAAAIFSAFLVAFIVMLGVVASPPWMPAERLTLNNHQKIIGYVLAQTQEGLTFMQAGSMNITQYEPGVVKDQVFCSDAPARDLPIIYYIRSIPGVDLGHYLSNHLGHYAHC
jgi:Ca2+/Na+ antiporter